MARSLVVKIVGDASSYEKALYKASRGTKTFTRDMEKAGRGAIAGSGIFRNFGRSLAFASGGFLAFESVSGFLRKSIDAARDAGVAQRSLAAQMKASGESFQANRDQIERVANSYAKFGFNSDEVTQALAVLERGTGNVNASIKLLGLTSDIARAKNIDLASAGTVVAKVFGGQETALRRSVPGLDKAAHGWDLIREAQQKMAGQAKAGTTQAETFAAALHDTEVIIGQALLPTINHYLGRLTVWLQKMNESGRLQRDVNQVMGAVTGVVNLLTGAFHQLNRITGSTKHTLELLFGLFAAAKIASMVSSITSIAKAVGLIGTAAEVSEAKVVAMNTAAAGGAAGGGVAGRGLGVGIGAGLLAAGASIGFGIGASQGQAGGRWRFQAADGKVYTAYGNEPKGNQTTIGGVPYKRGADGVWRPGTGRTAGGGAAPAVTAPRPGYAGLSPDQAAFVQAGFARAAADAAAPPRAQQRNRFAARAKAWEAYRQLVQKWVDRLSFNVDKAGITKSLADDLAALNREENYLKTQLKIDKNNLGLQRQLLSVEQQKTQIQQQQNQERRQQAQLAAQRRAAREQAAQFRALGLDPTGGALIPGAQALRKQLAALEARTAGTLIGRRNQALFARLQKVLSGRLGKVGKQVRESIQQILANIRQQLADATKAVSSDTGGTGSATLGSTIIPPRMVGQYALAGATPGYGYAPARAVVINGGVHLHGVQNVSQLENELQKRTGQRAQARRGPS